MAGKHSFGTKTAKRQSISWSKILLALTLLPLTSGVLMIFGWSLDLTVFISPEIQLQVGILLILLAFTAANAAQKHWLLSAGWLLIAAADFLFVIWVDTWAQTIAFVLGIIGLILLGIETYRRSKGAPKPSEKTKAAH